MCWRRSCDVSDGDDWSMGCGAHGITGVVREDEMMKMLGDLTMSDREAIEGLTSMGVTLEDALQAILGVNEADTMPEGALGSLPTRDTNSVVRENENMFDADRTQSLDMQKEAMGT